MPDFCRLGIRGTHLSVGPSHHGRLSGDRSYDGRGEPGVFFGALVGAMLGFLVKCHDPAQVFMGDSGSLPTGAAAGYGARHATGSRAADRRRNLRDGTLSVIMQVGYFKLTGRRVVGCSSLHNHFVFKGEPEMRIVIRFWIGPLCWRWSPWRA